jgi:hypothetical protein
MEYTLYKPTKKETGGAVKFNMHKTGKFSFMKAAKQIAPIGAEKVFGWEDDKCINVKMEKTDLSAILSVILGFKEEIKLYHQTENDNKVIEFIHVPDRAGFSLKFSHKLQNNAEANSVFVGISYEESMILKVFIENGIKQMLEAAANWGAADKQ